MEASALRTGISVKVVLPLGDRTDSLAQQGHIQRGTLTFRTPFVGLNIFMSIGERGGGLPRESGRVSIYICQHYRSFRAHTFTKVFKVPLRTTMRPFLIEGYKG